MSTMLIRGGRLLDPAHQRDGRHDLYIDGTRVAGIDRAPEGFHPARVVDASGCVVMPGIIDLCARLREPGAEHKGTIASESLAAAAAGITTLVCPPDTDPVVDETSVARMIRRRGDSAGHVRVLPLGALTRGLAGEQLAEMAALREAGCVGVSNGFAAIGNTLVLRRALEYAATFGLTVFLQPLDPWLHGHGLAHDGPVAARLGLTGIPPSAEIAELARTLALVEETGVRAHFGRLSCARSVDLIADARARGLPVSADTAAHQLHLTEDDLGRFDTAAHVVPPLRGRQDRDALRQGLATGVLSALCSDHQPHEVDAKLLPFGESAPGISALDTLLPLGLVLVAEGVLSLSELVHRLSAGPARILGLDAGHLGVGATADLCIVNPASQCALTPERWGSRGLNSPFLGATLPGRVECTLLAGQVVYERERENR